jgi:hypothetical protein
VSFLLTQFLQYDFLEDVKNGFVFSHKDESQVKHLGKVHVVVMMNEMPDRINFPRILTTFVS